ncbi:HNH endonuclease signature motif containing protein [Sphingomonas sp. CARO-RG-8B-R24-01]|uniref:HNH endonuclease signature motif containing protein n=1 Tax=Sphingomonas sp. CARO-RG-8B-R24-01 TaxID=2914831 RepID=UPI001F5AB744|nr:HNH endonuclease signature motif containing protein [Sphingomonas sp. CARO-RG-8B-R24-01]
MKGRAISYSAEEMAWLEANRLMVISDYHRAFCERFGRVDASLINLHSLRKRKGWSTGRTGQFAKGAAPMNKGVPCPPGKGGRHPNARKTQFKVGQRPHNTNYLGHERVSKDGYVEISVAETNPHTGFERRYVLKHRHLWELANGPVPEGCALKCLDSNPLNTDPANWEPVPREVLARLNGGRWRKTLAYDAASPELKPTVMAVAKLKHAAFCARKHIPNKPSLSESVSENMSER